MRVTTLILAFVASGSAWSENIGSLKTQPVLFQSKEGTELRLLPRFPQTMPSSSKPSNQSKGSSRLSSGSVCKSSLIQSDNPTPSSRPSAFGRDSPNSSRKQGGLPVARLSARGYAKSSYPLTTRGKEAPTKRVRPESVLKEAPSPARQILPTQGEAEKKKDVDARGRSREKRDRDNEKARERYWQRKERGEAGRTRTEEQKARKRVTNREWYTRKRIAEGKNPPAARPKARGSRASRRLPAQVGVGPGAVETPAGGAGRRGVVVTTGQSGIEKAQAPPQGSPIGASRASSQLGRGQQSQMNQPSHLVNQLHNTWVTSDPVPLKIPGSPPSIESLTQGRGEPPVEQYSP